MPEQVILAEIARDVSRLARYGREVPEIRATSLTEFHAELTRVADENAVRYYLNRVR